MSLPTSIDLPLRVDYQDEKDTERYQRDLVYELQGMYENIAENVNGTIRNNADVDGSQWKPTVQGTVAGVFTYSRQVGWSVRQGILTKIFFDVEWPATTATGNFYVELPYKVTLSNGGMPFLGVLQPSAINYGALRTDLVINAIPDTYRGEIFSTGSLQAITNLAVPNRGRLIGSIDYIGVADS